MTTEKKVHSLLLAAAYALLGSFPLAAQTPLSFDKTFNPSMIGPGGASTLVFNIVNNPSHAADGLAFTDVLPAGVTIAAPANVSSTCARAIPAPDGGAAISLVNG